MSIAARARPLDLSREMRSFIGRHTDKSFDWDAFPGSRGFPELERAQMRYIGAGGSPKADDPSTLKPGQFTLSLVHQPVGKYAACHSHEVVEHFLVLEGVLTVGWAWGDEVIEARLGPKRHGAEQGRPAARLPQRRGRAGVDVDQRRHGHAEAAGLCLPPARQRSAGRPPFRCRAGENPRLRSRQRRSAPAGVRSAYRALCRKTAGVGCRVRPIGLCRRGRCSTRPVSDGHGPSAEGRRGTRLFAPCRGRVFCHSRAASLSAGRSPGIRSKSALAQRT